jgi:hypothetical protein
MMMMMTMIIVIIIIIIISNGNRHVWNVNSLHIRIKTYTESTAIITLLLVVLFSSFTHGVIKRFTREINMNSLTFIAKVMWTCLKGQMRTEILKITNSRALSAFSPGHF